MFVLCVKNYQFTPRFPRTHKEGFKIDSGSEQTDFVVFQHCFCKY